MSKKNKNGNNNFGNILEQKSKDIRKWKLMDEKEIYKLCIEDFSVLQKQVRRNLFNQKGAKYPVYLRNLFINPSFARYIGDFVDEYKKKIKKASKFKPSKMKKNEFIDIPEDPQDDNEFEERLANDIIALRHIIAVGFRDVQKGFDNEIDLDKDLKLQILMDAYAKTDYKRIKVAKKFKLEDPDGNIVKAMAIYANIGQDSVYNLISLIDKSELDNKKKFRLFKKICGKGWKKVMGSAFTIMSKSKFVEYLYEKLEKGNKKFKFKILKEYCRYFKKVERRNWLIETSDFRRDFKKIIKKLEKSDIGFIKALKPILETKKK